MTESVRESNWQSNPILRNLQQFPILQRGLMGDNPRGCHVQSSGDIDEWLPILQDCADEFVREVTVRSAMPAGVEAGRKRGALHVDRRDIDSPLVLSIERALLSAD